MQDWVRGNSPREEPTIGKGGAKHFAQSDVGLLSSRGVLGEGGKSVGARKKRSFLHELRCRRTNSHFVES